MKKKDANKYKGLPILYLAQEMAFAPGIADGWPEVIPAPHTKNGRLVKLSPADCRAIAEELGL